MSTLDIFIKRLSKIGVNIELFGNYPWVYIDTINGVRVTEKFEGNHGFTVAFITPKNGARVEFTDIGVIFKLLRKYK